jgi:hypothetical protein
MENLDQQAEMEYVFREMMREIFNEMVQKGEIEMVVLPAEKVEEVKREFKKVPDRFVVKTCDDRSWTSTQLNFRWTKTDFVTMAKEVRLGPMLVPAYYFPMEETHPSVKSMLNRMTYSESEGYGAVGATTLPQFSAAALTSIRSLPSVSMWVLAAITSGESLEPN